MSDKIKLNATFEAFKKHDRGGVLTTLSVAYLLIAFILFGLFFWANFSAFGEVITWYGQIISMAAGGGDPSYASTNPPTALLRIVPGYLLLILALFVSAGLV